MTSAHRHSPTQGWWLAILVLVGISFASSANGETAITPQAVALHAEWLRHMPPPAQNPVICLVDTGVDITPDTAPILVGRLSVTTDGGLDDSAPGPGHGTLLASLIGAPVNGWGGVGLWPYARIVSVRAADGQAVFDWERYAGALSRCSRVVGVVAVNISIAGEDPGSERRRLFEDVVASVRAQGINVIAATGNSGGAPMFPGSARGILSVAGGDSAGLLCSFSSRASGVLTAPGCGVLAAGRHGMEQPVNGSSLSSPLASIVITSLRAYRPDLSLGQVEDLLRETGRPQSDGSWAIDVEAAYVRAGLASTVAAAKARLSREQLVGTPTSSRKRPPAVIAPQVRWIKVQRRAVLVRFRKPLPRTQRLRVFGRRARVLNATTIRAPRVRNRWKLGIVAVDRATKRRSALRNVMVPPLASKRRVG